MAALTPQRKKIRQRFLVAGGLLIVASMAIGVLNSWQGNRLVNHEIDLLQRQITQLQENNTESSELIKYLNSAAYVEEKARQDLGLKKVGEKAVVIADLKPTQKKTTLAADAPAETDEVSIPVKWWRLFFKTEVTVGSTEL